MEEPHSAPALIHFTTSGTWLADDLASFASDINASYRLLLLVRHLSRSREDVPEGIAGITEAAAEGFDRWMKNYGHPEGLSNRDNLLRWLYADRGAIAIVGDYGVFKALARVLSAMGYDTLPAPSEAAFRVNLAKALGRERDWNWPTSGILREYPHAAGAKAELEHLLEHDDQFVRAGSELSVHRIEIASPGGFSFAGLGEPIAQLRELIKDLWYRNRQESERGELEILKQTIALFSQDTLNPEEIVLVAIKLSDNQEAIGALIGSGRLVLEGQEPKTEGSPKKGTRSQERPQKQKGPRK